jgi:hypothetical protein
MHPVFSSLHFTTVIFSQIKVVRLASNLQPGEPSPYIYVPQWQGGPVIPPGTGFLFHHLLQLAGLQWRYSNPPSHREFHGYTKMNKNVIQYISCNWIIDFLEVYITPFFLQCLTVAEYLVISWTVTSEFTLMVPNNFIYMWNNAG